MRREVEQVEISGQLSVEKRHSAGIGANRVMTTLLLTYELVTMTNINGQIAANILPKHICNSFEC